MDYFDFISEYDGDRRSLILCVRKNNCNFICNRNTDMYDSIFNDKYIKFWQPDDCEHIMRFDDKDVHVEILEICDCSNYNKSDQKYLNARKQFWIEKLQGKEEDDIKWSNDLFNEIIKNYRKKYKDEYKHFIYFVNSIDNVHQKCYDMAKKLFYKQNNEWFLTMTYNEIWNYNNITLEERTVAMIVAHYIYDRRVKKCKFPFDKGNIHKKIKELIKEIHI